MTRWWMVAAAAAGLLLAGCAAEDSPASAAHDSGAAAALSPLGQEPGEIDPGNYRTTPLPKFGDAEDPSWAQSVEGQRMAEFVSLPYEVDPTLVDDGNAKVLRGGGALSLIISNEAADAANRLGMIAGFSTSRSTSETTGTKELLIAVFRFPDAAAASTAADELHTLLINDPSTNFPDEHATVHAIGGLPGTRASLRPFGGTFQIAAFTAHGPYVIHTWASTPETQRQWAEKVTAKTLDLQIPLIDQFPATPIDRLPELPIDIDEVLRYAVPKQSGDQRYTFDQAVFGPRGAAHFSTDAESSMSAFADTGTTNVAHDLDHLYLTKDADAAQQLAAAFAKDAEIGSGMAKIAGPPGVPGAACWRADSTRDVTTTYCLVQHDRYLAEILTPDMTTAYQIASAQYLILAAA